MTTPTAKLTKAQRAILERMADGTQVIYRWVGRFTSVRMAYMWDRTGETIRTPTIKPLRDAGLIAGIPTFHGTILTITPEGRAAIDSLTGPEKGKV